MSLWKVLSDPDRGEISMSDLLLLLDGKEVGFVRSILGKEYASWKRQHKKRDDVKAFIDAVFEGMGIPAKSAWSAISILREDEYLMALDADLIERDWSIEDFFSGELSLRKLCVIVDHLPDTSNLVRKISGPAGAWTLDQYMLADALDVLNYQTMLLAGALQIKGVKKLPKPPKPWYTRPVPEKKEEVKFTKTDDAIAFLNSL